MDSPDTLNPAANNPPASRPDEFNETAPVQPGTEVEPNAPAETPTAPTPTPPIPDAPTDNREQDDEDAQAQTVAGDAASSRAVQDSKHGGTTNPAQIVPDDEQDVVDHMQQMERSGRIDMDAYRGERSDDDESGMLGEGGMEPGDLDEHGNAAREATSVE